MAVVSPPHMLVVLQMTIMMGWRMASPVRAVQLCHVNLVNPCIYWM